MDFTTLDFETANNQNGNICAIGITTVQDGAISETYYRLVRPPDLDFAPRNIAIHGIKAEDVRGCPTLAELWPEIAARLNDRLVLAHNASFDIRHLCGALRFYDLQAPHLQWACSCRLAKQLWPELSCYKLSVIMDHLQIAFDHHHAGSDSLAVAELVLRGMRQLNCPDLPALLALFQIVPGKSVPYGGWIPQEAPRTPRRTLVDVVIRKGFNITAGPFHGKSVVVTGALQRLRREEVCRLIEQLGGYPKTAVSRKTNYLIVGVLDKRHLSNGSSESKKLRDAKSLREAGHDIQIITDLKFLKLISGYCTMVPKNEY